MGLIATAHDVTAYTDEQVEQMLRIYASLARGPLFVNENPEHECTDCELCEERARGNQ